ncbi:MAG TPA: zf-HC2 domain-containing protein [Phycisphaerae bacterium]|nr:zf-HC2 domain-containing protein [Phycisphaerae bacterium]
MDCQVAREKIGPYLDGELPVEQQRALQLHLDGCARCAAELEEFREVVGRLADAAGPSKVEAPPGLWDRIEQRMDRPPGGRTTARVIRLLRPPAALAASVAILVGVGTFVALWLSSGATTVQAAEIDYSALLDGVTGDVDVAFRRFVEQYGGQPIDPSEAHAAASGLSFAVPPELPGGYRLEQVHRLRFGSATGIAACYRLDQQPLLVFFHPPADKMYLGIHTASPCRIGQWRGSQVEVGRWRLVHFTDPTTCHCVLSTLDLQSELPAVLAALAPRFDAPGS